MFKIDFLIKNNVIIILIYNFLLLKKFVYYLKFKIIIRLFKYKINN